MTTLEVIQELFPGDTISRLVREAIARGEPADAPPRHVFDELVEIAVDLRTRIEADDLKGAMSLLLLRVIAIAVLPRPLLTTAPKAHERITRFIAIAAELLKHNPSLLVGETREERLASFGRVRRHVAGIWTDAVTLFREGSF